MSTKLPGVHSDTYTTAAALIDAALAAHLARHRPSTAADVSPTDAADVRYLAEVDSDLDVTGCA